MSKNVTIKIQKLVHQNITQCNVHCPLTSVKTKWDNISPVDGDQWFKYLLFIFISNFLGNHEYFSQYSTQQIIGDWRRISIFSIFSAGLHLLADGPLCCWTFWCLLKLFITSKTRRAHLDVYGSRIKELPGLKLPCVDKKMQQNLWNVIGVLFIFIFFDKSFDSFDEQHKNHFNPDTGTMPRSHP